MIDNSDLNAKLQEVICTGKNTIRFDEPTSPHQKATYLPNVSEIDLVVKERVDIAPGQSYTFIPSFEICLDAETFGLIQPVHSVGSKRPYIVQSTTVNVNYKGRLSVSIFNPGHSTIELLSGEHIAQLVLVQAASFIVR